MYRITRLFIVLATTFLLAFSARAQVTASLVAESLSVQAGRPLNVALRLEHQKKWHTYWLNAGTGYPTSLTWTLPAGWSASGLRWPTPKAVTDPVGNITGQGYEDVVYLPVTLTPPADLAPGTTITLQAKAAWLMCHETCVPGEAPVSLTLPVSSAPPEPDPLHGPALAKAIANLPRIDPAVTVSASYAGDTATLRVRGLPASAGKDSPWWFFPADDSVQYDQPQKRAVEPDGTLVLTLVRPPATPPPAEARLVGVLRASASGSLETADGTSIPAFQIDVPMPPAPAAAPAGKTAAAPASLLATLSLAFIGGLILNLMPCVFPVLGLKILGFVQQADSDRRKVTLHGLAFTAGVLLTFWTLGGLLVTFWQGTGWGTQLQNPAINFMVATTFLLFALSMSGVFEIGQSATRLGGVTANKSGYFFTLLEGAFITVVATPCSAPLLGAAIGTALTSLPASQAMLVFTAIALGLSAPYLLLSFFPQGVKLLPRPGAWMETLKQFLAFPIYAAVGFFVWVMVPQVSAEQHLNLIFAMVLIALGAWLYGRYATYSAKPAARRFGILGGLALLAAGLYVGWPSPPPADAVTWEPWSEKRVAELQAAGTPIYVDFTARWCATCQTNKKIVFHSEEVRRRFRELGVATLRGDWTNRDASITAELARWNRSAVPFNLVYLPGRSEPVQLPELLTPGIVLSAFAEK